MSDTECPVCNGEGSLELDDDGYRHRQYRDTCHMCGGSGRLDRLEEIKGAWAITNDEAISIEDEDGETL